MRWCLGLALWNGKDAILKERLFWELSQELGFGRTRVGRLGSYSGRGRGLPMLKRFASEGAERVAGNEMALDVEGVLDRGVNGKESVALVRAI
jgi:hypothetical protein